MKKINKLWMLGGIVGLLMACEENRLSEDKFLDEGTLPSEQIQEGVEKVNNPYWAFAKAYPGEVPDSVPRITEGVEVIIDADYKQVHANSRFSSFTSTQRQRFSTGLYAPPAEVITLIKPKGLDLNITWRIGATTCDLSEADQQKRYYHIHQNGSFDQDTLKVYNLFGGHIYFEIPPHETPIPFKIKGAVKSPDFVEGETDVDEWIEELKTTEVPWGEIRLKRVIWTLPTYILKTITDRTDFLQLVDFYNDIVLNDFTVYSGLSESAPGELHGAVDYPNRHVTDIQTCAGAAHSGYPAMYGEVYGTRGVKYASMWTGTDGWGWFHELGHNYQTTWMWGENGINEVNNNFHILHSQTRRNGAWPEQASRWPGVIERFVKVEDPTKNFDAPTGTPLGAVINEDRARILPFMQLAQKYGWRLFAYLGKTSRELSPADASQINHNDAISRQQRRREFFCLRVCEWAQRDLRPFFDAWGMKYNEGVGATMATLPALDPGDKFWETFDINLIPSFEDKETGGLTKLSNKAIWTVPGALDTKLWSVHSVCGPPGEAGKIPENMINGNEGTGDYWATPTNNWEGAGSARRPILTPQPWVIFDMVQTYKISGLQIRLRRNNSAIHLGLKKFKVEVAANPAGPWTSLGTFDNTTFVAAKEYVYTDDLTSAYPVTSATGRYLRLTLLESFPKANPAQENGFAFVDRFGAVGMEVE